MPLQNRVRPDGEIVCTPQRGTFLGNRGGRIHHPATKTLFPVRRWASRQWICCVLEFNNRKRAVMGPGSYTELFFLDEVTALAAGHRPCFECRRHRAVAFAEAWAKAAKQTRRPSAREMDLRLHGERLMGREKRLYPSNWSQLPDGAASISSGEMIVKRQNRALLWTFDGYQNTTAPKSPVDCLTPPGILEVLRAGYEPQWHKSAASL